MSEIDRLVELKDRISKIRTEMDKSLGKLEDASKKAKEKFGTDNIKKLQILLNNKSVVQKELDKKITVLEEQIETLLAELEDGDMENEE